MTAYVVQNFQVLYHQPAGGQDKSMRIDLSQAIRHLDQTSTSPQIITECIPEGSSDVVVRSSLAGTTVTVDFADVITDGTLSISLGF